MTIALCDQYLESNFDRFLEEFKTYLKFDSISTDPEYNGSCAECASWIGEHLAGLGFEVSHRETPGKPLVIATRPGAEGAPHVLFYGHYDVQPVDPLELWDTPPFEPTLKDDRIYARGAQDNKGQHFFFIKALETLIKQDLLKVGVTVLLEGEEEAGSEGIEAVLPSLKEELAADILMVCDTDMINADTPTITMGLRGIIALEVTLGGLTRDLHSGGHGGVVKNPATELARLVATLHDETGRIAVDGYYEGVDGPSEADQAFLEKIPFSAEEYTQSIGQPPLGGEQGKSAQQRLGFEPTIEVNGFHSGYGGPGSKTIIPSEATVKLTSRLVGNQDADRCLELLKAHIEQHAPEGLALTIGGERPGAQALMLSSESPVIQKACTVLGGLYDREPVLSWEGGSIPIVSAILRLIEGDALLVGFGLDENNIHAPNECFPLRSFKDGFRYSCAMLMALAE